MDVHIKSGIFVGEWENSIESSNEMRFSNDGQLLWGCKRSRKSKGGDNLLRAIDLLNGTELDFKIPNMDIEFVLDYLPFNEKAGLLLGCESQNGIRLILMEIVNNTLYSTGIYYNITNIGTICNLPKIQMLSSNLLYIEIIKVDTKTGLNMIPSLYILQIPFEKSGTIALKHQVELIYGHETDELCLFNNKLYYFVEKKQFGSIVEVALNGVENVENGKSKKRVISDIPIVVEHLSNRDFNVSCHKAKLYVLAFPHLAIFDLNSWSWSNIELLKYPHMIKPSLSCINSMGNLNVHFNKDASKCRLQSYLYQLEQPESLQRFAFIQCKRSHLLYKRSPLTNAIIQSNTSNYVEKLHIFNP